MAMSAYVARPDVSDLMLCAYPRALHPELYQPHDSVTLKNSTMRLDAHLSSAGHILVLRVASGTLTEVISDRREPLPKRDRLFEYRLRDSREKTIELDCGLSYSASWSMERLNPTVFLRQHEELLADCSRASLSVILCASNRFSPGPVSLLRTEVANNSVLVHAFHTFPEHLTVVKTQSLFELNGS